MYTLPGDREDTLCEKCQWAGTDIKINYKQKLNGYFFGVFEGIDLSVLSKEDMDDLRFRVARLTGKHLP